MMLLVRLSEAEDRMKLLAGLCEAEVFSESPSLLCPHRTWRT